MLLTTGSSPAVWKMLGKIGYDIIEPVPSLFTFNIKNPLLKDLLGIAVPNAEVKIKNTSFAESGPLLITHWGLSGPAVLKLSAWAARELFDLNYNFTISVNWTGKSSEDVEAEIQQNRKTQGKKNVANLQIAQLPKRLWQRMVKLNLPENINYASMNSQQISAMVETMTDCKIEVKGKSTFKDEFVTCGGIDTKNIHFKTMESKLHPGLHFAGEVTNIDAITGGFNFQAAWTTAFLAAKGICGE